MPTRAGPADRSCRNLMMDTAAHHRRILLPIHFVPLVILADPALDSLRHGRRDTGGIKQLEKQLVQGRPALTETIHLSQQEEKTGIATDVNEVIYLQPCVERVPEASSALMIDGESPYDYRMLISGVPIFNASHFANYSFLDRGGIMIAAIDKLTMTTERAAGCYANARAGVISIDPSRPWWDPSQATPLVARGVSVSPPFPQKAFSLIRINLFPLRKTHI
jgi:hypothetical protein